MEQIIKQTYNKIFSITSIMNNKLTCVTFIFIMSENRMQIPIKLSKSTHNNNSLKSIFFL